MKVKGHKVVAKVQIKHDRSPCFTLKCKNGLKIDFQLQEESETAKLHRI